MTPPDRWREAAREIRQTMKDADLVWSLISEGKLTGMLRRLFPAREEQDEKAHCDNSGRCVAPEDAVSIANCVYCGKELVQRNGQWFTWDSEMHPTQAVQSTESERQKEERDGK